MRDESVEKPGRKLKDLLADSRSHERSCSVSNCKTCSALIEGRCKAMNTVYQITCKVDNCEEQYGGEAYQPLRYSFDEHYRCAADPTRGSHKDKPLAKHYREKHPLHKGPPKLKLEIIEFGTSLVDRKIKGATFLRKNKPTLNDKSELIDMKKFLFV
jgi:hypothetical protein